MGIISPLIMFEYLILLYAIKVHILFVPIFACGDIRECHCLYVNRNLSVNRLACRDIIDELEHGLRSNANRTRPR